MICKEVHKKMDSYLSNQILGEELKSFESHLEDCTSCKHILQEVKLSLELLDNVKTVETDPFMFTRIQQRIINSYSRESRFFSRILQPIAATLIIGIGLTLGILLGTEYSGKMLDQSNITNDEMEYDGAFLTLDDSEYETMEAFLLNE